MLFLVIHEADKLLRPLQLSHVMLSRRGYRDYERFPIQILRQFRLPGVVSWYPKG